MKVRIVAGAIIARKNLELDKIEFLIIRRSKNDHWPLVYEFPRGGCDKGDENDIIKCLRREIYEETGLNPKILCYLGKYSYIRKDDNVESVQYNFLCKINYKDKVRLSHEHCEYKWVSNLGYIELLDIPYEMRKIIYKAFKILDVPISITDKIDEKIEE